MTLAVVKDESWYVLAIFSLILTAISFSVQQINNFNKRTAVCSSVCGHNIVLLCEEHRVVCQTSDTRVSGPRTALSLVQRHATRREGEREPGSRRTAARNQRRAKLPAMQRRRIAGVLRRVSDHRGSRAIGRKGLRLYAIPEEVPPLGRDVQLKAREADQVGTGSTDLPRVDAKLLKIK